MDIWIAICRKTVPKCSHCGEPIQLGEIMIAGRLWKTKDGRTRRWVKNFRWHAQKITPIGIRNCWMESGLEYIKTHPQEETRGRKRLQLSEKEKEERLKIQRQRARLVQKLKTLMEAPLDSQDTDMVVRIGSQIEELKERIKPLGGIPPSWQ